MLARDCLLCEATISHLISHVLDFLLRWVISHCTHKIFQFINGDLTIKFSCLSGILFLTPDHGVVEEVVHVLEGLSVTATLYEANERLDSVSTKSNCLFNWGNIYLPDVYCQVVTSACEHKSSI